MVKFIPFTLKTAFIVPTMKKNMLESVAYCPLRRGLNFSISKIPDLNLSQKGKLYHYFSSLWQNLKSGR